MIDLGDVVRITVPVRDPADTLTDPDTATLTITLPDGTTATPTVSLPPAVTGQVVVDYLTTQAGRHVYRLTTTGPVTAYADVLDVRPALPPFITSLKAAKKHLNIPESRTSDDDELRDFIEATTSVVERYVGSVARAPYVETHDGGKSGLILRHPPILSITSAAEAGSSVTADGYALDAPSGVLRRVSGGQAQSWAGGVAQVTVSYVAGRAVMDAAHTRAALIILKHMWETQRLSSGRPALSDEPGGYAPNPSTYAVPYRALELLGEPMSAFA